MSSSRSSSWSCAGTSSAGCSDLWAGLWDLRAASYLRAGLPAPEIIGLATRIKPTEFVEQWMKKFGDSLTAVAFYDKRSQYTELHGCHTVTNMTQDLSRWVINFNFRGEEEFQHRPTVTTVEGHPRGVMRGKDSSRRQICMMEHSVYEDLDPDDIHLIMVKIYF